MQYYVSLPTGWTINGKWPVLIVVESANKQFKETLEIFAKARKDAPFILAAPLVTTNGGANYRQADTYHYSEATWREIERDRCKFDLDGITAVAADVQEHFSGEERYFLTGWEAGGHTVWAMILQHPERMAGAAPAVTNYAGRCLDAGASSSAGRIDLPVTVFQLEAGRHLVPGKFVYQQSQQAMQVATAQGFRNVTERLVANRPHGPLADEVVAYFWSLWKARRQ
jgi:poly(3-hydroxybutyrate) depolymerase